MTHEPTQNQPMTVAAPYYGALSHPTRGLSNLYFLLDLSQAGERVSQIHVSVWNPVDSAHLADWLKNQGVQTLICNDIEDCHQHELQETGIEVMPVAGTDILQEIRNWAKSIGTDLLAPVLPAPTTN